MEQFNSGTFRSGLVKFGQVKSGQVLMHLRMEFDSGVGPTCFFCSSIAQYFSTLPYYFFFHNKVSIFGFHLAEAGVLGHILVFASWC